MQPLAQQNLLQLHDIHLPAAPGWWPPAPGWWILAVCLLGLLFAITRWLARWYRRTRWRRKVLAEFNRFGQHAEHINDSVFVTEISRHLRQLALTLYPARDVASLAGRRWLAFLDEHTDQPVFGRVPGSYLTEAPYRKIEINLTDEEKKQLLQMARHWADYNTRQHLQDNRHAV